MTYSAQNRKIQSIDLGKIPFKEAWDIQEHLLASIGAIKTANRKLSPAQQKPTPNYLLLCEHPPVITLGKSGKTEHLLMSEQMLNHLGIEFFKINRGGDITFHGPGQLVGYPILDLDNFFTDIHRYMRLLEETIIRTLAEFGIEASRLPGATGVWIEPDNPQKARKICAMGIRCSKWITMHGFALNVTTDLKYFNYIIPCGINDKRVTSMYAETGKKWDLDEVKPVVKKHFADLFEAGFEEQFPADFGINNKTLTHERRY